MIPKNETARPPRPHQSMKHRLPVSEMKPVVETFFQEQKEIYLATVGNSQVPSIESAEYRYVAGKHYMILNPGSLFVKEFQEGTVFSGYIKNKASNGFRHTKRAYSQFVCHERSSEDEVFLSLRESDPSIAWMLAEGHRSKCFQLGFDTITLVLGMGEIFSLEEDMEPQFAPYTVTGVKRYENSHHVLMEYCGKKVIFNTLVEGNEYTTLTPKDSNKMEYIQSDGECEFFDGRDRHFTSKMKILSEEQMLDTYQKLKDTNHCYFESSENLVALRFIREE